MKLNKRIGVVIGRVYKNINKRLLHGIIEQARTIGYTVYIFTLNEECHDERITAGEENLFSLMNFSQLDGIIFVPYTLVSKYVEQFLQEKCTVPVVRIGIEKDKFIPVWYDDKSEIEETTLHLIYGHGCRKILCLTGYADLQVAQNRAIGYRQAMKRAGLDYTDDDIIFGDFWVYAAQNLACEIADGKRPKPDAVVCANDTMAIALCDALMEKGFSIPDDIRITGYDGYTDARIHIPAITTYQNSQEQLGRNAMCRLYKEITGDDIEPCRNDKGILLCRESCGCNSGRESFDTNEFNYKEVENGLMDNTLSAALLGASTLNDFIANIIATRYTFMDSSRFDSEKFYLCLCNDWDSVRVQHGVRFYRTEGYSQKMIFISAEHERINFDSADMFPDLPKNNEMPVIFFTPVHFRERCFGYACLATNGVIDDYNFNYVRFCREMNNGLEFLCSQNELKRLAYREYTENSRDKLTGLFLLENSMNVWEEISDTAELYREDIYLIAVSVGGLRHIENAAGSDVSDRYLVMFAEILAKNCNSKERIFKAGEKEFVIIGTENTPVNRPNNYLNQVEEAIRRQSTAIDGNYIVYAKSEIRLIPMTQTLYANDVFEEIGKMFEKISETSHSGLSEQTHYSALVELRREIFLHPDFDWNGDICSQRVNLSKSYFHKMYSRLFGISFMQDLQQSRLSYAKKLLLTTDLLLPDIAVKCGYDYYNFMRVFKKETNMTPTQFRKNHK